MIIDRSRGYVYVRYQRDGVVRKELVGSTHEPQIIDQANFRAQQIRQSRRANPYGFEIRKQRLLIEDAADMFLKLHGEKRQSKKGINEFSRHVGRIKQAWGGRYVDSITSDDMRDYRETRRRQGLKESTVNREHTAIITLIITLFNCLTRWRRSGQIPRSVILPEFNPAAQVSKVNEDRFIRERLLTDEEYGNLWACSDGRTRRIILAAMNLPLRLEDLRQLRKSQISRQHGQFRGVQAKTGREFALPINRAMWELIRTAPGERILDFTGFQQRRKRSVTRAGLRGFQFRDLRRTAATTLHDGGVPLKTISAMLGHSTVMTTIRYLGLKGENLTMAGDLLAAKYAARPEPAMVPVETVPETVPTPTKKSRQENAKPHRKTVRFKRV